MHLLRDASASTLAVYYAGTIPFILAFLYFWADMSHSPFARDHLAEASLLVSLLFLSMKFCQALFASRLRAQIAAEPMPHWTFRQGLRVFLIQAIIQPPGLFAIPLALIFVVPFAWAYGFYQSVTALAGVETHSPSELFRSARRQTSLWVLQNHVGLGVALAFGLCVFADCAIVVFGIPTILKTLFGFETVFSRSPFSMMNSTFLVTVCALTYLLMDPILKAFYTLRCFYGASLNSGEDLKAHVRTMRIAVLLMLAVSFQASWAFTQVSPVELDRQINDVIHQSRYTWRMPHDGVEPADSDKSILTRFIDSAVALVQSGLRAVYRALTEFFRGLVPEARPIRVGGASFGTSSFWTLLLLSAVVLALIVVVVRTRRTRHAAVPVVVATSAMVLPDLGSDEISADQLPADSWTRIARELLEQREYRLAMRAFHLSALAYLAQHNLIAITRYKTNRDYEAELSRRGHSIPHLVAVFRENLSVFEGIWYGSHSVDMEIVEQFAVNVDRIKSAA